MQSPIQGKFLEDDEPIGITGILNQPISSADLFPTSSYPSVVDSIFSAPVATPQSNLISSTSIPYIYPFNGGKSVPIVSNVGFVNNAGQNQVQVKIKQGPDYETVAGSAGDDFLRAMNGATRSDTDSAQVAVQFTDQNSKVIQTVTNAQPQATKRKYGADWNLGDEEEGKKVVYWNTPVPTNATNVNVKVVYTDVMSGPYKQTQEGQGRGDMPNIIGSWQGNVNTGKFAINANDMSIMKSIMGQQFGNNPTGAQVDRIISSIQTVLKNIGFYLNPRRPEQPYNNSTGGYDTGYDLLRK